MTTGFVMATRIISMTHFNVKRRLLERSTFDEKNFAKEFFPPHASIRSLEFCTRIARKKNPTV
jgi:hypothetical protein